MVRHYGGVGANIAYTLALSGEHPLLFSTAGQDFPEYGRRLETLGVDCSGVRVIADKFTASFFVNTDLDNAQIASSYTGAMADPADLPLAEAHGEPDDFVINSPATRVPWSAISKKLSSLDCVRFLTLDSKLSVWTTKRFERVS